MAAERTLSIIKPDAVAKNVIGKIYSRFETNGLRIVAAQMRHLSRAEAEGFYAVHRERPFFRDLVDFMTSGPVMIQVLEGDGAIAKNRDLMGATDPKKAAKRVIRADFVRRSMPMRRLRCPDTAKDEIAFSRARIYGRDAKRFRQVRQSTCSTSTPQVSRASSPPREVSRQTGPALGPPAPAPTSTDDDHNFRCAGSLRQRRFAARRS
jgi:nucleoside-diphosphate kinase